MSTTLSFPSFVNSNIRERTELSVAVVAGSNELPVQSTEGFSAGDMIYVGELGRETCEKAVVDGVGAENVLTLASELQHAHTAFSAVTSVLGDRIRVYRAVNVSDEPPELDAFSVLASRSIKPDSPDTYYTDSAGSSGYWYHHTYFNETTMEETSLDEFEAVRGSDFAHYASLAAIRDEAGFSDAVNLSDVSVDAKRREAEADINSALGSFMETPFKRPVPAIIETITIKLAGALLFAWAYRREASKDERVKEARKMLTDLASGYASTGDPDNEVASGIRGGFGDEDDGRRLTNIGDIY